MCAEVERPQNVRSYSAPLGGYRTDAESFAFRTHELGEPTGIDATCCGGAV